MRERSLFLALLAGMGAITYHSTSTPDKASQQVQSTEAASARMGSSERELSETFTRFDKRREFTISLESDGSWKLTAPVFENVRFDWVIATVPDPQGSNLKLDFDRNVESILLAASTAGYQFERYWLPWKAENRSTKQPSYVVRPESEDPNVHPAGYEISAPEDHRDGLPGVLLFRSAKKDCAPLAMFLVSESPVAGIAPDEFRAAVSLGRALSSLDGTADDQYLRVIGPSFSGSLTGLSTLIKNAKPQFEGVFLWSATQDARSRETFIDSLKTIPVKQLSFVTPDLDRTIDQFVKYVRSNWNDKTPILLLTEEATALGTGIRPEDLDQSSNKADKILGKPDKPFRKLHKTRDLAAIWRVPFPRNLTQLRNASEQQDHLPGFSDSSRRDEAPRTGLLLSLKEERDASLEIPVFSKEQTPISQESVLFTIGDLLKTGAVHYAGIVASDPLDTLFLARYLRKACPNIRVFTPNPDLLFEHGSDSSDYSGILGISPYPLFPLSQVWSATPTRSVYPFPSAWSQATYNSTIYVLQTLPHDPKQKFDVRNTTDPFFDSPDSLWLTVAGRSGFEPITVLGSDQPQAPKGERHFRPEYWPGWGYGFGVLCSICIAFCGLILFTTPNGGRSLALFSAKLEELPEDREDFRLFHTPDPAPKAYYLFLIGACLTCLLIIWVAVPGFILQWNVNRGIPHQLEITGIVLTLTGIAVVLLLRFAAPAAGHPAAARSSDSRLHLHPVANAFAFTGGIVLLSQAKSLLSAPIGKPQTPVVSLLWWFFCIGCLCIGAMIATSALPFWNVIEILRRRKLRTRGLLGRLSTKGYAWGTLGVASLVVVLAGYAAYMIFRYSPVDFLAAYRSLDLTNHVSPLVPATLLFVALTMLAFVQLRRLAYYDDRLPDLPALGDNFRPKLVSLIHQVKRRIRKSTPHPLHKVVFLLLVLFLCSVFPGPAQTLEGWPLERLLMAAAVAVGTLILLNWVRLVLLWSAFGEFLQQLERHPIRHTFSLLPRGFIWSPVWQGGGKKRLHVAIVRSLECMQALLDHPLTPLAMKDELNKALNEKNKDSLASITKDLLQAAAYRHRFSWAKYRILEKELTKIAKLAVEYLNQNTWRRGDYELKSELASREETKNALHTSWPEYREQEPATICGELVAYRFLAFINFVLWHLDNLVTYISAGFLLLVVALNSYAFRSRTIIDWLMTLLFLVLTGGIVVVFAQADRDAILSRITGTEEGKLDRHFFTHLISYGGVPALALLAIHFPMIGRFFFSWVKPALEAIH